MLCTAQRLSYDGDVETPAMVVALADSGLTVRVLVREGESAVEVWDAETQCWKHGDPELLVKVPRWVLTRLGLPARD
jgi:hypothetical protein